MSRDKLAYTLKKLNEDRRFFMSFFSFKAHTIVKRMPKADELLLDKNAKPVDSSIEGVDDELSQGCNLAAPIRPDILL